VWRRGMEKPIKTINRFRCPADISKLDYVSKDNTDYLVRLDEFYYRLFDYKYPSKRDFKNFIKRNSIKNIGIVFDNKFLIDELLSGLKFDNIYYWYNPGLFIDIEEYINKIDNKKFNIDGIFIPSNNNRSIISLKHIEGLFFEYLEENKYTLFIEPGEEFLHDDELKYLEYILVNYKINVVICHCGVFGNKFKVDKFGSNKFWNLYEHVLNELLQLASIYDNLYLEYSSLSDINKLNIISKFIKNNNNIIYKIIPGSSYPSIYSDLNYNEFILKNKIGDDLFEIIKNNIIYDYNYGEIRYVHDES
jgi:hypothetical protein